MVDNDTIVAAEVLETVNGEKVALKSPYEAKEFIYVMPWKSYAEEVDEHGSLRAKHESRDTAEGAIRAAEDFDWPDGFAAHAEWDDHAFGYKSGAWLIDRAAWPTAKEFFEFVGFETAEETEVA